MDYIKIMTVFLAACFLAACASSPSPGNYFFLTKYGNIENPHSESGKFDTQDQARNHIKKILTPACNCTPDDEADTFMVFIHGGLNIPSKAIERAEAISHKIDELNARSSDNENERKAEKIRPIFVNWRSGPFISYGDHLVHYRRGERVRFAGYLTAPFVLIEDVGRAIFRFPRNLVQTFNIYRKTYPFSGSNSGRNAYHLQGQIADSDTEAFGSFVPAFDHRGAISKIGQGIETTATHTVGAVANIWMDTLGAGSWRAMQRRTELMFAKSRPLERPVNVTLENYTDERTGEMNIFLDELEKISKDKSVILVAHSMGAIIANNILASRPDLKIDRIIYMGAAATIKDFQSYVIPYMDRHESTEFYNYMLHPLAENREAPVHGLGGVGSLLVQIDDMYEVPFSEAERTLGRWENVMNNLNYFNVDYVSNDDLAKPIRKRIHLRTLPFDTSSPTHHGDFAKEDFINDENGYFWRPDYHNGKGGEARGQ